MSMNKVKIKAIDLSICENAALSAKTNLELLLFLHIVLFFTLIYNEAFDGTNKISPVISNLFLIVFMFL